MAEKKSAVQESNLRLLKEMRDIVLLRHASDNGLSREHGFKLINSAIISAILYDHLILTCRANQTPE